VEELRSKAALAELYRAGLESFLASGARLSWPRPSTPRVTVVLVLYNRAELTLRCLRSLAEPQHVSLDVLIVDNASQDETGMLLDRLDGVRMIRNHENRGFIRAVNQAARRARGRHLLCLNNDAELLPGALAAAVRTLESAPDVGAVGGKLILTDGRLQEAGSIVWNDGSCCGYGRGASPSAPEYAFRRDVDFVSGAFLLTPRELFLQHGGFDEAYVPAYYEDADYCLKLWESGHRVVYEPLSTLIHFEFASSASMAHAVEQQAARREIFRRRHAAWLAGKAAPRPENVIGARDAARGGLRVLFVDDRVPHDRLGSGFPRSREMLSALVALGHRATFYPLSFPAEDWGSVYADVPREVEVMLGAGRGGLEPFLRERRGLFDVILVSRPHNMEMVRTVLAPEGGGTDPTPVVYDAEALWCLREVGQRHLKGTPLAPAQVQALVAAEARLAEGAAAVISVSAAEGEMFRAAGMHPVFVLGHAVEAAPTPAGFDEREGILFVGAIHEDASPNADSVLWFAGDVLPLVREALGQAVPFRIVGLNRSPRIAALARPGVEVCGPVEDAAPFHDRARVFVVPTRFGAGIPLKAYHAAAHGLPIVATPLVAAQLGWEAGRDLLVGDGPRELAQRCAELYRDAGLWRRLRDQALSRVRAECARAAFRDRLALILREAVGAAAGTSERFGA
jgi:GT2 family glycosyltransferase/glycosyltransferase involved in cell wall biosynthesis